MNLPEDVHASPNHEGGRGIVNVYYFPQKDFYPFTEFFFQELSEAEKEKALSFRFAEDSSNYIVCHGVLRFLLSQKLNHTNSELAILYGVNNKPYIKGNKIHFNISHSKELCTIAFFKNDEVGIDLETIKPGIDYKTISVSCFSDKEQQQVMNSKLPLENFYMLWTRKEAFLKAIGLGFNTNLKEITTCQGINTIDYNRLCKFRKCNIRSRYYIYSTKRGSHFISIATTEKAAVNFARIEPGNLNPFFN